MRKVLEDGKLSLNEKFNFYCNLRCNTASAVTLKGYCV
jgi:hypothetical protein